MMGRWLDAFLKFISLEDSPSHNPEFCGTLCDCECKDCYSLGECACVNCDCGKLMGYETTKGL